MRGLSCIPFLSLSACIHVYRVDSITWDMHKSLSAHQQCSVILINPKHKVERCTRTPPLFPLFLNRFSSSSFIVFLLPPPPSQGILARCNSARASYLFQQDKLNYDVTYDTGDKSIQCGRVNDTFKLWLTWKAKVEEREKGRCVGREGGRREGCG